MSGLLAQQATASEKLRDLRVGALFMEAGTGKTRAATELVRSSDTDYVLWVTPFRTKDNLRAELDKWGGLDCDIIGVESISLSDRIYLDTRQRLERAERAFIIMDESLKIKNGDAKRTKRLLEMRDMSSYRLILNGTPLSRNLLDLWTQLDFLSPKILKMSYREFQDAYCEYVRITHHSRGYGNSASREFIKKYHNIPHLYSLIEPYIFESRLSLSVGKRHINHSYGLCSEEEELYNKVKNKILSDDYLMARNSNIFLELTQMLQHSYSNSPEKYEITEGLLKDTDRSKTLIFAKYVVTQERLAEEFKGVRVMSYGKHSYGLNLQQYDTVIFFDKTWDYAQREQAEHRVWRTGQDSDVTYHDLTANTGLDTMIDDNINRKRSLLSILKGMGKTELMEKL